MTKIRALQESIVADCNELDTLLENIETSLKQGNLAHAAKDWTRCKVLVKQVKNLEYKDSHLQVLAKKHVFKILEKARKEVQKDFK